MAAILENSSSLTVLSLEQDTPNASPGLEEPAQGSVPPPSTTLEGVPDLPFEEQVARLPTFVSTPQTEEDALYLTAEMPMNKAGFSYIPCAPSPIVSPAPNYPFLRPIPSFPRTSNPTSRVHLSFIDRSPHLRISQDALTVSTPLGFRSGRANIPVRAGAWYCEMIIERGGGEPSEALDGSHVRLGWGRREAKLNSPVGLDGYSYGIRDKTGQKVTLSKPIPYFGKGFGTGDVVGMYISLPEAKQEEDAPQDKGKGREVDSDPSASSSDPSASSAAVDENGASSSSAPLLPRPSSPIKPNLAPLQITRHRIPIRYKNQLYFESIDPPVSKEMEALLEPEAPAAAPPPPPTPASAPGVKVPIALAPRKPTTIINKTLPSVDSMRSVHRVQPLRPIPILHGSKMAFFVNGESPGVAFEDVMDFRPLREAITKRMRGALAEVINGRTAVAKEGTVDDGMMGYYPFVSSYGGGRVTFNPGPDFRFPPPNDIDAYLLDPTGDHPRTFSPAVASNSEPKVKKDPSTTEQISLDIPPLAYTSSASSSEAVVPPAVDEPPPPSSSSSRTWTPLSSIYPSYHALQQALDERDELLFIDSYIPDAPNPIPSALDLAARKRKSKEDSSEPQGGGKKGKKVVAKKSRLGLHDGLVDTNSPAPTNSEAGEESSEGSTPARELGGGEEGADQPQQQPSSSNLNPQAGPFVFNGVEVAPKAAHHYYQQYLQQHLEAQRQTSLVQQHQYQQQQQFPNQPQQRQQSPNRYYAAPIPLAPHSPHYRAQPPLNPNLNPKYFSPPAPDLSQPPAFRPYTVPASYSHEQQQPQFSPQFSPPRAYGQQLAGSSQQQQHGDPSQQQFPVAVEGEDEDGLGSEDAEGEMEDEAEDGAGEREGEWEGGGIKEHVEEEEEGGDGRVE